MQEIVEEIQSLTNEIIKKNAELQACYEVLKQNGGDYRQINYIIEEIDAINHQLAIFAKAVSGGGKHDP